MGAVLRLTEESLAPVSCMAAETGCPRSDRCPTLPLWQGLDAVICRYLDGITLAELVRGEVP